MPRKEFFQKMTDFAAIDFETANGRRTSVCSVGVVVVRGGEVVENNEPGIHQHTDHFN